MKRDYKQVEVVLARILKGENGELLKEYKSLCIPFCLSVRKRFGFTDIPIKAVYDELADSAVNEAVAKVPGGKPFLTLLQNAFRDTCREKRRQMRDSRASELFDDTADSDPILPLKKMAIFRTPVSEAIRREHQEATRRALENEEPTSRIILYRKYGGEKLTDVGKSIEMKYHEVKNTFYANLASIKRQLDHFKKDFETQ
jgi:hypothetical protein